MSKPFFLPADTSPIALVRSFETLPNRNHAITPSQKGTPAITTVAVAPSIRAEPLSRSLTDAGTSERILSWASKEDRVAIPRSSAASTPCLPPTNFGSPDPEHISQDVTTHLDSLRPLSPNLASPALSLGRIRPPPTTSSTKASFASFPSSLAATPHALSRNPARFSDHKSAAPSDPRPALPLLYQRTKSQGALDYSRMAETWDRGAEPRTDIIKAGELSWGARREAFSEEKRNRSSSRTGKGRVEKRIEATLAQAEPASNARSRKSSHILGLFKENTTLQDSKKGQDKAKLSSGLVEEDSVVGKIGLGCDNRRFEGRGEYAPCAADIARCGVVREKAESAIAQSNEPFEKQGKQTSDELVQQAHRESSVGSETSMPLSNVSNEPKYSFDYSGQCPTCGQEESIQRIAKTSHSTSPLRQFEDLRDHHNLAPSFYDKSPSARHKSTSVESIHSVAVSTQLRSERSEKINPDHGVSSVAIKDVAELEEDDDEESEKEQISSALYYPHQAPSPNALEDITSDNAEQFKESQDSGIAHDSEPQSPDSQNSDTPSEDVNIALQSRNESRYLHGDLQMARTYLGAPTPTKAVESGASSASESEYESFDESARSVLGEYSSLTDEAETTPTATPTARDSFSKPSLRRVRHHQVAPLGAVELKPYNHQVGGHTTVFRFSKRAVCKQLSNRENEFYEVVEREHPELLKFLPRYVRPILEHPIIKVSTLRISQAISTPLPRYCDV